MSAQLPDEVFSMPLLERAAIERTRTKCEVREALIQVALLALLTGVACFAFIRFHWAQGGYALVAAMLVSVIAGYVIWGIAGEPLMEWFGLDAVQHQWLPLSEMPELAKACEEAPGVRSYLELVRAKGRPVTCGEACAIYDWLEARAGLNGLAEALDHKQSEK
jgi:hypothetical protein